MFEQRGNPNVREGAVSETRSGSYGLIKAVFDQSLIVLPDRVATAPGSDTHGVTLGGFCG